MSSVLISGASRGIGRAAALALDRAGHDVIAGVRDEEAAGRLAAEASARLRTVRLDVTDAGSVLAAADAAGGRLDALVNNAGVVVGGLVESLDLDALRRQLEVNVVGQVAVTQALLPALRAATGRVVFMSSVSGRVSAPGLTAYTASKFAIEAIADGLRLEVRRWGIRVVLVEPGSTDTDLWRNAEAQFDTEVGAMAAEQRELYSGLLTGMHKLIRTTARRAAPVDKVVAAVVEAVTAERPRTRYVVGADARGQILLKAALPDRAYDALAARMTGA
jgi:NAD(P)-dependent dehydrogenase (short-subunit alcohol dehydrogenase family)